MFERSDRILLSLAHVKAEVQRFVEGVAGEMFGRDLDLSTAYIGTQYTNH
jgi:hypothetical protein